MAELTKEALQEDLKTAMRGGDKIRVSTLRLVLAVIKNREIEKGAGLDAAELVAVIGSGIKQRRESIEGFRKAGRAELVAQEEAELAVLQVYLPPALGEEELETLILQGMRETGAASAKDMGLLMKWLMPKIAGRADGKTVNQKVREKLT